MAETLTPEQFAAEVSRVASDKFAMYVDPGDVEAWRPYQEEGFTPEQALTEDLAIDAEPGS
jgi:hypothetical protein